MARPVKEGLDYFPLDVGIDQDDKLIVVIMKFGMEGLGVVVRLMAEIYKNSYFYTWSEREQYVFSNRVNVNINTVNEIVNECIKWGFFNQKCFEDHKVLTSRGFQNRYIGASKRRKSITFVNEYTLIDLEKACEKVSFPIISVDVNGNEVNVYINPVKDSNMLAESTQRENEREKEKEREKEIKDISAEIENFRTSYSSELLVHIDSYFDFIASQRKSKKIGEGIYRKVYQQFKRYSPIKVEYAIKTHMYNIEHSKAPEEYTFGILRQTTEEEAILKLPSLTLRNKSAGARNAVSSNDRHSARNQSAADKIREVEERERIRDQAAVLENR